MDQHYRNELAARIRRLRNDDYKVVVRKDGRKAHSRVTSWDILAIDTGKAYLCKHNSFFR